MLAKFPQLYEFSRAFPSVSPSAAPAAGED